MNDLHIEFENFSRIRFISFSLAVRIVVSIDFYYPDLVQIYLVAALPRLRRFRNKSRKSSLKVGSVSASRTYSDRTITREAFQNQLDALISQIYLERNSTCFGQFLCPSSGVFHCKHSNGICHTGYADCLQAVSITCMTYTITVCVKWKTPDDGQRNCSKHVEFLSKINLRN